MFSFVILLNQLRNIAMKRIITLFDAFALLTNLNSFSYAQALEDFKPSSVNQLGKRTLRSIPKGGYVPNFMHRKPKKYSLILVV